MYRWTTCLSKVWFRYLHPIRSDNPSDMGHQAKTTVDADLSKVATDVRGR